MVFGDLLPGSVPRFRLDLEVVSFMRKSHDFRYERAAWNGKNV